MVEMCIRDRAGTVHAGELFHSLSFCPDFKSGNAGFCCIQFALAGICGGKLLRYECVDGAGGCGVPAFSGDEISIVWKEIKIS